MAKLWSRMKRLPIINGRNTADLRRFCCRHVGQEAFSGQQVDAGAIADGIYNQPHDVLLIRLLV